MLIADENIPPVIIAALRNISVNVLSIKENHSGSPGESIIELAQRTGRNNMATKIKTTLLTGLFFFGLLTGLQAQEKYEYAIITSDGLKIEVTKHTKEKFPIEGTVADVAVIMKLEEMVKEGWEVYNTAPILVADGKVLKHVFYLRKKIKE